MATRRHQREEDESSARGSHPGRFEIPVAALVLAAVAGLAAAAVLLAVVRAVG